MSQLRSFVRAIGILSSLVIIGCGDGEDEESPEGQEQTGLEIAGTWDSNFDSIETLTDVSWDTVGEGYESSSEIVRFDNEENVLITTGPAFDDPETDVFNRVIWTEPEGGSFYYCTVAFGLETLSDALNSTATADASDPDAMNSCGAGSWTRLSEQ
jgi:hypothetical protein